MLAAAVAAKHYWGGNMIETKKQSLERQRRSLKRERSSWDKLYRDLGDYILPGRLRFLQDNVNRGDVRNNKSHNNTAFMSARTLKSGMHSGITSPARPWFRLTTPDPALSDYGPVKEWLYQVTQRMQTVFHRSNLYNALPTIFGDCGTFGIAAAAIYEDPKDLMRAYTFPVGQYYVATSARGDVDTLVRELKMTVRQLVQQFGEDNLSRSVKGLIDSNNLEQWIDVVHVIRPNDDHDPESPLAKHKPIESTWYEKAGDEGLFLRSSGFDESPIMVPRWEVMGEDVYGSGPGQVSIGDVKSLQFMEKRKAQAIDKMVNPPMIGDSSLRTRKTSLLPGDVTYVDSSLGVQGFRPAFEINFDINSVSQEIQKTEQRINSAFFADLFLMLTMSDRRQITATEVAERHEEKLLMLGPVLERLNDELLNPIIDRTFNIMLRAGAIPPPPQEIQGMDLRVEHISIMAQAQKMVATASIDRFTGYVGQLAQFDPTVLDKFNMDQTVDEYSDMMGVPATIVRGDNEVQEIRQQRAQAQQQAQQQEAMQQQAQTAKALSETDTEGENALSDIIKGTRGI